MKCIKENEKGEECGKPTFGATLCLKHEREAMIKNVVAHIKKVLGAK